MNSAIIIGRRAVSYRSVRFGMLLAAVVGLAGIGSALLPRSAVAQPAGAGPAPSAGPTGPVKIAVASPARIFNDMMETKTLQSKMQDDSKKFEDTKNQKKAAIDQIRSQRDNLLPAHPQYEELNNQLINASIEMKVWMEAERAKAEHLQKRQMKSLFEKIQNAIGEVAKQEGVDLVVADKKDPLPSDAELEQVDIRALRGAILQKSVLYSTDRIDISQKVLALLDTRYKAAGGAAIIPSPTTPGAGPGAVGAPAAVAPGRGLNK